MECQVLLLRKRKEENKCHLCDMLYNTSDDAMHVTSEIETKKTQKIELSQQQSLF